MKSYRGIIAGIVAFFMLGAMVASAMPIAPKPDSPLQLSTDTDRQTPVTAMEFSPDGRTLATGYQDSEIVLWNLSTRSERRTVRGHNGAPVTGLAFDSNGTLVSSGRDTVVRLWNSETGSEEQQFHGHAQPTLDVAFSYDGEMIASVGEDTRVLIWDASSAELLRVLHGHQDFVTSVAFHPDNEMLATADRDGRIFLWDPHTGEQRKALLGHDGAVHSIAFSPDGNQLASGGQDTVIRIWDVDQGVEVDRFTGHSQPVRSLAFSPQAPFLASGGDDSRTLIWNFRSGRLLRTLEEQNDMVNAISFAPTGNAVASGARDGDVVVVNTQNWRVEGELRKSPATGVGSTNERTSSPEENTDAAGFMSSVFSTNLGTMASTASFSPNEPGGPILILRSPSSKFADFYSEILLAEGLNYFTTMDVSSVSAGTLHDYDVVLLAEVEVSENQATMFADWVDDGGNLIAMRPDDNLAPLLGLTERTDTLSGGYYRIEASNAPGAGITSETMQFHGTANRYDTENAIEIARLYTDASSSTSNPAVTIRDVGENGGSAAAFAFDVAESVVYTRQGNPAWSGQERDGFSPVRSNDLYFGQAQGDPQPDWVDLDKVEIPQADELQRLLANIIIHVNQPNKPLPRFWYFPRGEKAVVILTGDDHGNDGTSAQFDEFIEISPENCSVDDWECIRASSYIYTSTPLSNSVAASYDAQGFEIGLHVSTGCADYTESSLRSNYTNQLAEWQEKYSSLPMPVSNRTHCIAWSDWSTQAQVAYEHGIRFDTNYYYWPPGWVLDRPGFMNGSGMPMRFANLDGSLVDVYQAHTHMTDESGQTYPFTSNKLLDNALGSKGYYGAFTVNAHTDEDHSSVAHAVISSAQARNVPVIASRQMLTWVDGRNSSSFGQLNWDDGLLGFTISKDDGARGLQAMLPYRSGTDTLQGITHGSDPVEYEVVTVKGIEYARFFAHSGNWAATYGIDTTPPTVIQTTPEDGATDISAGVQVVAEFSEGLDRTTLNSSSFILNSDGGGVAASVSYDAHTHSAHLLPESPLAGQTTYTATLIGGPDGVRDVAGNPLEADYSWSFTTGGIDCPCTIWDESDTPTVVSTEDPNAVELGVKFQSEVDGYVTAIRFYKGPQNSGSHTVSLWSSTGQLLGRATSGSGSESGWQEVLFAEPVAIGAETTYIASYHTSSGYYSHDGRFFEESGVDNPPLKALQSGESGPNGVFRYSGSPIFPNQTWQATNYWVDVVFDLSIEDTTPPTVTQVTPANESTNVSINADVTATFSEAIDSSTVNSSSFILEAGGEDVEAIVSYEGESRRARLTPASPLAEETTYTATVNGGNEGIKDLTGNALEEDFSWTFTTGAADPDEPEVNTIWNESDEPTVVTTDDSNAAELGVKFRSDVDGYITAIRFYKGPQNSGSHTVSLWSSTGQLLARATPSAGLGDGWQEVSFAEPVAISAETVYIASYHTASGYYSKDENYFSSSGVERGPLQALQDGVSGPNGVYRYSGTPVFPDQTWQATNYWVDVVFNLSAEDTTPPTVTEISPADEATDVSISTEITATFSESLDPDTVNTGTFVLEADGTPVEAGVTYEGSNRRARLTPVSPLDEETTYTVVLQGGSGGITDLAGNALEGDYTWTFTTAAEEPDDPGDPEVHTLWDESATPTVVTTNDSNAVELGVKFRSDVDGYITGIRYYRGPQNTGDKTISLWTISGQLVAQTAGDSGSGTGWQEISFDEPVAISAETVYIASYHTTSGFYSKTENFFNSSGVDRGPLHALRNVPNNPNGVYQYSASPALPNQTWRATNYWVDVVFEAS
jgi:WD40 repeat protein